MVPALSVVAELGGAELPASCIEAALEVIADPGAKPSSAEQPCNRPAHANPNQAFAYGRDFTIPVFSSCFDHVARFRSGYKRLARGIDPVTRRNMTQQLALLRSYP